INDYVIYSYRGICKITDIKEEGVTKTKRMHYILQPLRDEKATLMTPVENDKVSLRPIISREEAQELMDSLSSLEAEWITNNRLRSTTFTSISRNGSLKDSLGVLIAFLRQQKILKKENKRLTMPDDKILKAIDTRIYEELAYALNVSPESIKREISKII
ncbi:MAG: CarD family transcriptional regulator, partial [Lachnospiraceae bacterium]